MKKSMPIVPGKLLIIFVVIVGILLTMTGLLYSSFALIEPVKSVSFTSEKLNYNKKEPGSWKVEKSAKWISQKKAQITFDVDTIERKNNPYTDIIFVLDTSLSMQGEKLIKLKEGMIQLINNHLENNQNRVALISFNTNSQILSELTNDKEVILSNINSLTSEGSTNYYQALVNVNEVLKNYTKEENRDVVVLFFTDGYPNVDTPSEESYFKYLKKEYPYLVVNGIQFEMGQNTLSPLRKITDRQIVANSNNLNQKLIEASTIRVAYSEFNITDYIDSTYFNINSMNDIKANQGRISYKKENQTVIWDLSNLTSGFQAKLTIDLELKEEFFNEDIIISTNKREIINVKIGSDTDSINSDKTPILKRMFHITYDGNGVNGCVVDNIPSNKDVLVFDIVSMEKTVPKCENYQFKGWKINSGSIKMINEDYFSMPEEDIVLTAEWVRKTVNLSIDGTINEYIQPVLQKVSSKEKMWKYKTSTTKIFIENSIHDIPGSIESWDLSENGNSGVMGHLVLNEDGVTHTIYIQGDGEIIANKDSSNLFKEFSKLEVLEGLKYLDTSNVTSMDSMFYRMGTKSLSVDISHFDTSKVINMHMLFLYSEVSEINIKGIDTSHVTNMEYMFSNCKNLTEIDLSDLNGDCVTSMLYMFSNNSGLQKINFTNFTTRDLENCYGIFWYCRSLKELNLNGFNTSNVKNMGQMFLNCASLDELNISHFNTSNVTNMNNMFGSCVSLTGLNLSNFNTSNVTNMGNMFSSCTNLKSLELSNFDTSNVIDMSSMFYNCSQLLNIDVSNFDTSNVKNMESMFGSCSGIKNLELGNFNTLNVINMKNMFSNCKSLVDLNLENFDTSKVTEMTSMFQSCLGLTNLDLSIFNTVNVIDMSSLFLNCQNLITLDLSNFNTSKVKTMRDMFGQCMKLETLDVSSFDTRNVTTMWHMFYMCNLLTSLNLNGFDMSNVMDTNSMFYGCHNLSTTITILNLDTGDYTKMFEGAANLNDAQIIVNYIDETSDLVDLMIETKSVDSDVIKGKMSSKNNITIDTENINSNCLEAYSGAKIILKEVTNNYQIQSFKLNGILVEDNSFIMPDNDVVITDVKLYERNINIETNNISSNLLRAVPGTTIVLSYSTNNYQIYSFKLNGILVEGNSFTMPDNDVIITDVQIAYSITIDTANITSNLSSVVSETNIILSETTNNYQVQSFYMNGVLVEGNSFVMPSENVVITKVYYEVIIESEHNPYPSSLDNQVYGEHIFYEATSLTVILEYQTQSTLFDYIYLYDGVNKQYGKYGGTTKKTETITIPGNYIKITFKTNTTLNNYYGFKATVIPNYN